MGSHGAGQGIMKPLEGTLALGGESADYLGQEEERSPSFRKTGVKFTSKAVEPCSGRVNPFPSPPDASASFRRDGSTDSRPASPLVRAAQECGTSRSSGQSGRRSSGAGLFGESLLVGSLPVGNPPVGRQLHRLEHRMSSLESSNEQVLWELQGLHEGIRELHNLLSTHLTGAVRDDGLSAAPRPGINHDTSTGKGAQSA